MVFIVEHVSRKVGFSVGNTRITDLDYAYDFFLSAERSEFTDVLKVMGDESAKFGLLVSWATTKIHNMVVGPATSDITETPQES